MNPECGGGGARGHWGRRRPGSRGCGGRCGRARRYLGSAVAGPAGSVWAAGPASAAQRGPPLRTPRPLALRLRCPLGPPLRLPRRLGRPPHVRDWRRRARRAPPRPLRGPRALRRQRRPAGGGGHTRPTAQPRRRGRAPQTSQRRAGPTPGRASLAPLCDNGWRRATATALCGRYEAAGPLTAGYTESAWPRGRARAAKGVERFPHPPGGGASAARASPPAVAMATRGWSPWHRPPPCVLRHSLAT